MQAEFQRLTRGDARFNAELRSFLSTAYNLQSIADYEAGPGSPINSERAAAAVTEAGHFVAHVPSLIETVGSRPA